jgi:preprotein translocase subunit SecD
VSTLSTAGLDSVIPSDSQLLWGDADDTMQGVSGRALYLVKREPEMTGGSVASAEARVGLQTTNPAAWGVSMKMTPKGRSDFASVTGNNVGRQLAIVLDGVVSSAPNIHERIPSGDASITGSFDVESSRDLAIVLRAGALPAPVTILEERTVGPSLGADSIRQGMIAIVGSAAAVFVFMLIYYRLSGLIADVALVLNLVILLACMAAFGATLTLPGIAGIVLTIGMAVDANVLINERIREELRGGRTPISAIETGFTRAYGTIIDSQLTTFIAGLVMFWLGSGPIRGFAVTLTLGIMTTVYTAFTISRAAMTASTGWEGFRSGSPPASSLSYVSNTRPPSASPSE